MNVKRIGSILALVLVIAATATYTVSSLTANDSAADEPVRVASNSVSMPIQGWGDGGAYTRGSAELYDGLGAPPVRPSYIKDIVIHESLSENVGVRKSYSHDSGFGMSMATVRSDSTSASPLDEPDEYEMNSGKEFRLELGEDFAPYIQFGLHGPSETYALFMVLVDYEQVEFTLDGMTGLLHEIRMPRGTELLIPINIGPLSSGTHDVEIIFFGDPYSGYDQIGVSPLLETLYHDDLRINAMSQRKMVIVDGNDQPARKLKAKYFGGVPLPSEFGSGLLASFAKPGDGHPMDMESQLRDDVADAGSEYRFRTWTTRHETYGSGSQAMMMFVDYHLVPVNGDELLLVELGAGEEAIIDTSVVLPDDPGIHQMFAFVALDPYTPFAGEKARQPWSDTSGLKLAIDVR